MASDAILPTTTIEEALSEAYVRALAGAAGYTTSKRDFDFDGVDLTVDAGGDFRPRLDIQLKATINAVPKDGSISYFCPKRNYDFLRVPTQTPRILVLFQLPAEQKDWLLVGADEMIIRHRAHWLSLKGMPETDNATGCTVRLPVANRLDVEGLSALMHKSREGAL